MIHHTSVYISVFRVDEREKYLTTWSSGKTFIPQPEQYQIHLLTPTTCQVCRQSPPCVTQISTGAETQISASFCLGYYL